VWERREVCRGIVFWHRILLLELEKVLEMMVWEGCGGIVFWPLVLIGCLDNIWEWKVSVVVFGF